MIDPIQIIIFFAITAFIGFMTWIHCRGKGDRTGGTEKATRDYFLAGGGLSWIFVAGSITLTNLSTCRLVGTGRCYRP